MYPCISVTSYVCRQYQKPASSLQVPCKFPASAYPIYLQHDRVAEKSATRMHLVHLPRIPPWTSATHLQRRKISNADATQMQRTCRELAGNLQGTCMELADSFRYNVHTHGRNVEKNIISVRSSHGTVLVNSSTHTFFPSLSRAHH